MDGMRVALVVTTTVTRPYLSTNAKMVQSFFIATEVVVVLPQRLLNQWVFI
jgi:hypothetical protein